MKAEQQTDQDHGDDINDFVEKCPAQRSKHQLKSIRSNGDGERRPDTVARYLWIAK